MGVALVACSDSTSPDPSFALAVNPSELTLIRGATGVVHITVTGEDGFNAPVTLSVPGLGNDITAEFESNPTTSTSTLTFAVSTGASTGPRTLTLVGGAGGRSAEAAVSLNIPATLAGDPGETHAPGVVGEVRTLVIDGEEFHYEVIDGLAIFQGDIVLGQAEGLEERLTQNLQHNLASVSQRQHTGTQAAGRAWAAVCGQNFGFGCGRWEGGVVPYSFANNWGNDETNAMMRARVRDAMTHWEDRVSSLRFVERNSGDRIVIRNGGGCSSDIGRVEITFFEPQAINLTPAANPACTLGVVIHEIGHAVGFWHEQARMDANNFIRIDFGAVQDFRLHNFFNHGGLGNDVRTYDFNSIMHYPCNAFSRDSRNTIAPLDPNVACFDADGNALVGQRNGLSEGDILGAYTLYPPVYSITGATAFEVNYRFDLGLSFTPRPVRDEYIVWTSDRVTGILATGRNVSLIASGLPNGLHNITASVIILGTTVAQRSITLTLNNTPPVVDLGPDRDVDLNRRFSVTATVTDAEDGACPACDYAWQPEPALDLGSRAEYRFGREGSQTISLVVTDGGGATGTDEITVNVVNTPPEPVMDVPSAGSSFSAGASITASGFATDINEGPGPGPGELHCSRLSWWSSNTSDAFAPSNIGCNPVLTFGSPGTRVIVLEATDSRGRTAVVETAVSVTACGTNCQPDVSFVIDTPPNLNPAPFDPPFTGPGYLLNTPLSFTGTINDADVPPDNPVAFEWRLAPLGIVLGQGTVTVPAGPVAATTSLTWTPHPDVASWTTCFITARPFTISLWVRDQRGATSTFSRTIYLACQFV